MNATNHAMQRVVDRLAASGLDVESAEQVARTAEAFAAKCSPFESVALRLRSISFVGQAWSDTSNGDTIVAIIRGRMVTTFMFRRRTQPFTASALNVERTVSL